MIGMLREMLADHGGEGQAQIAVDIDLANRHGGRLAQLLLGDAHGVGQTAAVFVNNLHEFLGHGGSAVQHDGEAGQPLGNLGQDIEAQRRGNENALFIAGALSGGEFISAVAGADGDGQGIHARAGSEFFHFFRPGIAGIGGGNLHVVLHAGQTAQFAFHHNAVIVGVFHNLLGHGDVLFKGKMAAVDHHGGEAAVDAALAGFEIRAVIQMQHDGQIGFLHCGFHQLHQVGMVGIGAGALADLQNHRRVFFLGRLGDALHDFHVVHIECADGIAAFISLFKHFFGSNQWHRFHPPLNTVRFIIQDFSAFEQAPGNIYPAWAAIAPA